MNRPVLLKGMAAKVQDAVLVLGSGFCQFLANGPAPLSNACRSMSLASGMADTAILTETVKMIMISAVWAGYGREKNFNGT